MGKVAKSKIVMNETKADALFGRLRELATRAQNLRDVVLVLSQDLPLLTDSAARDLARMALYEENFSHSDLNSKRIASLLEEICTISYGDGRAYSAYGDALGRIQIAWDKVEADWRKVVAARGRDCSRQLSRMASALDSLIYDSCEITIPSRIQDHLKLLPIGGALNFRDAYAQELSTESGRRRFLRYLNFYPAFVDGLIDLENETIIRAAPAGWRRISTLFFASVLALTGFMLILLACWLGTVANLSGWPFKIDRVKEYCLAYAFLLIGAIAHVVITLLKQDRSASSSSQALSDWVLRIHVRESAFYVSALSLCCGALAMPFLFATGISWQTAFFVGYSYDSFIDLFLRRFEGVVSSSAVLKSEGLV
jgi:hypothetical protein